MQHQRHPKSRIKAIVHHQHVVLIGFDAPLTGRGRRVQGSGRSAVHVIDCENDRHKGHVS